MVTNKLYVKTINKIALTLSITFCLTYLLYEFKNIGSDNFYFLLLSATLPLVVLFTRLKKYLFAKRYFFLVICTGLFFCSINFGNQGLENLEVNGFIYKPIEPIEVIKTIKKTISAN